KVAPIDDRHSAELRLPRVDRLGSRWIESDLEVVVHGINTRENKPIDLLIADPNVDLCRFKPLCPKSPWRPHRPGNWNFGAERPAHPGRSRAIQHHPYRGGRQKTRAADLTQTPAPLPHSKEYPAEEHR